jgi:hypothetical protein
MRRRSSQVSPACGCLGLTAQHGAGARLGLDSRGVELLAPSAEGTRHLAVTQLPSYCTGESEAGVASRQALRLAPRRHSFVLGRGFRNPIVWGIGAVSSDCEAWRGDPASGPT